ncbi:hypothetical protein [Robertkochia marina]|nr:hypothetical protein [Robertkochia marina]
MKYKEYAPGGVYFEEYPEMSREFLLFSSPGKGDRSTIPDELSTLMRQ